MRENHLKDSFFLGKFKYFGSLKQFNQLNAKMKETNRLTYLAMTKYYYIESFLIYILFFYIVKIQVFAKFGDTCQATDYLCLLLMSKIVPIFDFVAFEFFPFPNLKIFIYCLRAHHCS